MHTPITSANVCVFKCLPLYLVAPTSFMKVTRTVTLHSVTVLDYGAVVTCLGSNMNSDGSTHTDQAAATLQVQGEMDAW